MYYLCMHCAQAQMFMAMTGVRRFVTENGKMGNNYFHQSPAVTESIRTD